MRCRTGSSRIEIDLKHIFLVTEGVAASQKQFQDDIREQISQHTDRLLADDHRRPVVLNSWDNPHDEAALGPADIVSAPAVEDVDVGSVKAFHHNGTVLFESSQMTAVTAVGIRTAHLPRTACKPWCSCACHAESRIRSPQLFDRILGSLFVGYSGLPVLSRKCDQQSCHLRAQPMSYVTYFFPRWFLARVVSFVLTTTPLAGPVASLKVQRTVPGHADIFTYAKLGDVGKMKHLFENGLASPHDVHAESGVTALHVRARPTQLILDRTLLICIARGQSSSD